MPIRLITEMTGAEARAAASPSLRAYADQNGMEIRGVRFELELTRETIERASPSRSAFRDMLATHAPEGR